MASSSFDPNQMEGINDINVTPFVDVVLVLLVIFMVTAPMMMKDIIGLKLPKTSSSDSQPLSTLAIAITKNGQYIINGELMTLEGLREKAFSMQKSNKGVQAVLSADVDARHGDVVAAIDVIKLAGIDNFAIQVEKSAK
jgi:biopolymer transport protein ExbD